MFALPSGYLGVQGVEPLLPQCAVSLEPFVEFGQGLRPEAVDPPLGLLTNLDQPRLPQYPQMP